MDNITFVIKADNTDKIKDGVDEAIERALEGIGIHLEGEAKEALEADPRRIDTGLLRNSITYALSGKTPHITSYKADKPDKSGVVKSGTYSGTAPDEGDKAVYIGSNVEYAPYVHEGVYGRMEANKFLKNAIEWNKDQLPDYVKKEIDKIQID